MKENKHLDMRYKKLTVEALLKSLFCGLLVAFGVIFIMGAVFWITGIENLALVVLSLCIALVFVTLVAGAIFYIAKFHPTVTANARRIDSLGLHERIITMIDYQNDDSVMATLQRNDAMQALSKVDKKSIRFKFNNKLFVALSITGFFSIGISVISILSAAGLLPSASDIIKEVNDRPDYIPVSYFAEDGCTIEGETEQLVLLGENALPVIAIPDEGYSFEGWDDGYRKPTRNDKKIDCPLVLTAIFVPLDEDGEDEGDDGPSGENGDAPGEEEGNNGSPGQSGEEGDNPGESGGGETSRDKNFIIDGTENNDYKLHLPKAKEDIMQYLKDNIDKLSEEERAIIEAYINIL